MTLNGPKLIVKLQCPISTNVEDPMILVYNEDRTFETHIAYDKHWKVIFNEFGLPQYGRHKFFAEVVVEGGYIQFVNQINIDLGW